MRMGGRMIKETITYTDIVGENKTEERCFDMGSIMQEEKEFRKTITRDGLTIGDPEIYHTNFLGVPHYNNFVEFDIDEQRMIREMVAITGRDRRDIIREGIRYLYDEVKLWDKKKTEYYKPVKVEWFEDGKR